MWRAWKPTGNHCHIRTNYTLRDQFKEHFADWKQPWYFAKAGDTSKLLQEIGYVNVYYSDDYVTLPDRRIYSKFVKTVVMKSYLDHPAIASHRIIGDISS
jgi:hypothetical protein